MSSLNIENNPRAWIAQLTSVAYSAFAGLFLVVLGQSMVWVIAAFGVTLMAFNLQSLNARVVAAGVTVVTVGMGALRSSNSRSVTMAAAGVTCLLIVAWTPRRRRILGVNVIVLVVLLILAELGIRTVSRWDGSREFKPLEIYRQTSEGGPDEVSQTEAGYENGLRRTTDQPLGAERRILIFGGSTVQCAEVSDSQTWPSALQRHLGGAEGTWIVENHGVSAATATNRVAALESITDLGSGDLVLFYVGVNDAGASFTLRELPVPVLREVPRLNTALRRLSSYSIFADKLFRLLVFGGISTSERARADALAEFRKALDRAATYSESRGARFIPVLQGHLFTRANPTDYEKGLAAVYSTRLPEVVKAIYPDLWNIVRNYRDAIDARSALDDLKRSPYYDWHHVDARGNEMIAKFVYDRIDWDK